MRLQLSLPRVEPTVMALPSICPYKGCQRAHFQHHQEVMKPLHDTEYEVVLAQRYTCLRCEQTWRQCIFATSKPPRPARDRKPRRPIACGCCSSTGGTPWSLGRPKDQGLWSRLTRYCTWRGSHGKVLDGTNNPGSSGPRTEGGAERAIGWWVKEPYRTMRGYKRRKSAVNVSRLLAWCGNHRDRGGSDQALVIA